MDVDPLPLIKKRQSRNLRAHLGRRDGDEPEPEPAAEQSGDESGVSTPNSSPLAARMQKKKRGKLSTRLSFGGEEEVSPVQHGLSKLGLTPPQGDSSFTSKKSTLSRSVSLRPHPSLTSPSANLPSTPPPNRPTYSAEDLSSLKASTPSSAGRLPRTSILDEEAYESLMGGGGGDMDVSIVDGTSPFLLRVRQS